MSEQSRRESNASGGAKDSKSPSRVFMDPDRTVAENILRTPDLAGDGEIKLQAKMSLLNGCTVIIGSIIGSGIFVSPTGVLLYTGSVNASLLVWTISGVFSMVRSPFTVTSPFFETLLTSSCCRSALTVTRNWAV